MEDSGREWRRVKCLQVEIGARHFKNISSIIFFQMCSFKVKSGKHIFVLPIEGDNHPPAFL